MYVMTTAMWEQPSDYLGSLSHPQDPPNAQT